MCLNHLKRLQCFTNSINEYQYNIIYQTPRALNVCSNDIFFFVQVDLVPISVMLITHAHNNNNNNSIVYKCGFILLARHFTRCFLLKLSISHQTPLSKNHINMYIYIYYV